MSTRVLNLQFLPIESGAFHSLTGVEFRSKLVLSSVLEILYKGLAVSLLAKFPGHFCIDVYVYTYSSVFASLFIFTE